MSYHSDGGQNDSTVPALQQRRAPYLVRMIKPNLIVSHDWHVQPICQRSLTVSSPKRGRGSRFRNFIRMSSNLIARETGALQHAPAFLREPSKHIELRYRGQAIFVVPSLIPGAISMHDRADSAGRSRRAKYQRSTSAQSARATRAHGRLTPGSCNGLFSEGFPTAVQGHLPRLTQRTCSITCASHFPQTGQTTKATGRLYCSSATFQEYHEILPAASARQIKCFRLAATSRE